jgi:anti-sigma factor RsiW
MSDDRTHDDITALLPAAALDVLEQDELRRVLDHTRGCPECLRRLAEHQESVARLALRLPARPMDAARAAGIRDRLLNRARRNSSRPAPRDPSRARVAAGTLRWWSGLACAAGLAGLLLIHHSVHRPLDYGWLAAGVLAVTLAVLALYVRKQATRHAALQERLTRLEQQSAVMPGKKSMWADTPEEP